MLNYALDIAFQMSKISAWKVLALDCAGKFKNFPYGLTFILRKVYEKLNLT